LLIASASVGEALLAVLDAQHMVGGAGQRLVAAGQEAAVVEAVQHGAQHVQLLGQHGIGLVRIHRRPARGPCWRCIPSARDFSSLAMPM
jgi:hypothetical protein